MSEVVPAAVRPRARALRATAVATFCCLRHLPRFFRSTPQTPLRVFGIVALDTLQVLRTRRPLSRARVRELALLLDFLGYANAACDRKDLRAAAYRSSLRGLRAAGHGDLVAAYLSRLWSYEHRRPPVGGGAAGFAEALAYREAVVRLSLAAAGAIARDRASPDDEIRASRSDADMDALVRMLVQCQIIDDVLDYGEDAAAGLPSLLTACSSRPRALAAAAQASRYYAVSPGAVWPVKAALAAFSLAARVVVAAARFWHDVARTDDVAQTGPARATLKS